jgi:hypothetical protein
MDEEPAVDAIDAAWEHLHPGERQVHRMKIRYPDKRVSSRTALDHVFTTDGVGLAEDEWGIEIKRLQFVGNNGKRNDFGIRKVLSPYLKDRSMLHDALRLREYGFTRRIAVVGYAFDYTKHNLEEAAKVHTNDVGSPPQHRRHDRERRPGDDPATHGVRRRDLRPSRLPPGTTGTGHLRCMEAPGRR